MNRYRLVFTKNGKYESGFDFKSLNNKSAIKFCLRVLETCEYKNLDLYKYDKGVLVQIAFIAL